MAERVDLDAMEAPTDSESGDAQYNADVWELRNRITALVAELRAARKVVDATRAAGVAVRSGANCFTELAKLVVAVEVYDQATTP